MCSGRVDVRLTQTFGGLGTPSPLVKSPSDDLDANLEPVTVPVPGGGACAVRGRARALVSAHARYAHERWYIACVAGMVAGRLGTAFLPFFGKFLHGDNASQYPGSLDFATRYEAVILNACARYSQDVRKSSRRVPGLDSASKRAVHKVISQQTVAASSSSTLSYVLG